MFKTYIISFRRSKQQGGGEGLRIHEKPVVIEILSLYTIPIF